MQQASSWLLRSLLLQVFFSVLLGWVMLVPRQSWGARLKPLLSRDFTAAHLDWLMLAFMQLAALAVLELRRAGEGAEGLAICLIIGGWVNPVPYVLRAFGVNAFQLGGSWPQRLSAALSGGSSVLITLGWGLLLSKAW